MKTTSKVKAFINDLKTFDILCIQDVVTLQKKYSDKFAAEN